MSRRSAAVAAIAAVGVTLMLAFDLLSTLELPARDAAVRALAPRPANATAVIAIDERSLRDVGPWPWSRETIARLVDRAADSGARGVVLDVLLSDPRQGDEVLARALRRLPSAAVAVLAERDQWLLPSPPLAAATTVAHGNFELDHDGILRRFASTKQSRNRAFNALSIEAAAMIGSATVPVGRSIAPAFRTRARDVPQVSAADLLRAPQPAIRHRVVFLGPTALGLGDRVLTPVSAPLSPDAGVTVHAAATESLLRRENVGELAPVFGGIAAGIAVGSILGTRRRSRTTRLGVALALFAVVTGAGFALLARAGIAVPFVALMLCIAISAATVEANLMAAALRQSRAAASRLGTGLGVAPAARDEELSVKLEEIATRVAEHRAQQIESKRLLAHELKTPLASMRGLTQLLSGFELSDGERRRVASLLEAEAGKLQSMVTALLDLERLPLRDFDRSSVITDLGEIVRSRVELLCASSDRPVTVSVPPGVLVRADAMLIERVVDNLVGNAIQYTPPPTPIRVSVRPSDHTAILEVEDRGPGIAESERERLFQRFVRGRSAAGTEGLGLGLSFVAEVARWHGGTVTVENADEGGARFRVVLPRGAG